MDHSSAEDFLFQFFLNAIFFLQLELEFLKTFLYFMVEIFLLYSFYFTQFLLEFFQCLHVMV